MATQVNDDLKRVAFWCSQNSLLINPVKTKVLVVGTRQMLQRVPSDLNFVLLGKELVPVPSAKDLGLFVDSTLSFDEHITITTVSSCMASLVQINRVKHLFDVKTLENVINALVFSKLFYCSTVWSGTSKKNVKKLQRVQNFAARLVTKARKYDHITPLLYQLKWLPVKSMLLYKVGVLAFKCVKGLVPSHLTACFNKISTMHDKDTRNKDLINIPYCKSASGQRTFLYRGIRLWNSLPTELRELNEIGRFKRKLKEFLINSYHYNL